MADGYLSDAFADTVLAAVLTGGALPSGYWVGLTLALPTDGDGTGLEVPAVAEYGRQYVPADGASWASLGVGSRSVESAVDVEFATAITDWGEVLGYTLYDTETAGTYLGFGITNPTIVTAGMAVRLPAGAIVWTLPTID